MKHALRKADILIIGGLALFFILVIFIAMDTGLTGKVSTGTTVNITDSTPINCTVSVFSGLNTVSFPCILLGEPREDVVTDTNLVAMYQYVPGDADLWRVHNPNLPSYVVSDLQFLSRRSGYIMVMSGANSYTIEGFQVASTNIPMGQGWNLVGYPAFDVRNVSPGLAGINNYTEARTYNNSAGAHLSYINGVGGTLTQIRPGEGYWINATNGLTWTVLS